MGKFDELNPVDGPPPIQEHDFPPGVTRSRPFVVERAKRGNGAHEPAPIERPIPKGESAFALVERNIPDPVRLCDPWATEGINIIAGRPKLGKTTLIRQKLAAAATGGSFWEANFIKPVRCAFLSLEEGELLCRMKFKAAGFEEAALAGIQLFFDWPRGLDGVDLLDRYLTEQQDVQMVAIDSLTKFRQVPDARTPAFQADYDAISTLHDMAKRHPGICLDVAHHTRKAKSDDPIDDISGTYGLTAAADSYAVLRHSGDGAVMYVGGRLWMRNDSEYKLKRANQRWTLEGVNLGLTDDQQDTLRRVKETPGITGAELSRQLGISNPSAWERLDGLLAKGFVSKQFGRVYPKD